MLEMIDLCFKQNSTVWIPDLHHSLYLNCLFSVLSRMDPNKQLNKKESNNGLTSAKQKYLKMESSIL